MVMVDTLADLTGSPGPFLGKVFQVLQARGVIESRRGPHGGYRLCLRADQITLASIVDVLDGKGWRFSCLLGLGECMGHPTCAARFCCKEVRQKVTSELSRLTVRDLADISQGKP